ncbi:MAG: hypothetical protein JNJ54_11915 [Myxococcaceae bacterium]|nr:hypothetical protein [Myxococcaceae bacterium]
MSRHPDCCATPRLETDARFKATWGPVATRVARCATCSALWHEEWSSRARFDDEPDDDVSVYQRLGDVVVRCPRCHSVNASSVEALVEFDRMRCADCGFEELVDAHQLKLEWNVRG